MAIAFLNNISFSGGAQAQSLRLENLASDPASGNEGQLYFNTGTDVVKVYANGAWVEIGSDDENDFLTGLSFNTSNGVLTATVSNQSDVTVDLDGRYALSSDIPGTIVESVTAGTYLTNSGTAAAVVLDHDDTSRSDTTSTDAPGYGGTFEAVTSVTTNATGHVTAIDVSTVTMPSAENYTWTLSADSGTNQTINSGNTVDIAGGTYITTAVGATDTVTITHDNTSRTDTTSTDSSNTFTVVDSVTTNATGHVTAINVKTQTVSDDDTTSLPIKNSGGTTQFTSTDVTGLRFEGGTNVTVGFTSADQTVTINSTDQYQGTVTGTGTTNTLPKWTNGGSGVLGNSSITDDGTTVTIAGNLDVEGTTTTIDSTTVAIGDNMMKYAKDNTANASDIGWYGKIVSSGTKYPGMWYDASTGVSTPKFVLGIATTEPAGTGTIATAGTLVADLEGNADTATTLENSQNFSITGDITASAVSFNGSAEVQLNASIDSNVVGATELNVSGNGTNGQVLASDGDGTFSWVDQTATAPVDDVTASTANDELGISISPTTGNVVVGIDINGMSASLGQAAAVDDLLIIYDKSATQNKKVRLDNLLELIGVNRSKRINLNSSVSGVTRAEAGGVTTFTINVETIFGSGTIAQNVMCEVIGNAENEGDTVYADIGRGPETGSGSNEMTVAFVGSVANGDYQVLLNRIGEFEAV